jgi:drug/metabolite transporter (DMT)-like permease
MALLLGTVAIWGSTPQVTSVAGDYTSPIMLTTLRAVPTAVVLLLAMPLLRFRLPRTRSAWAFTAAGGLLMVGVFLGGFTEAVIKAGPSNAIVMSSTSPFWVALLSRAVYRQPIAMRTLVGLVVGFAGIVVVFSSHLGTQAGAGSTLIGLGLALAAALGWALGTLIVKEQLTRQPDTDLLGVVTGQYMVGGIALLALALPIEGTGPTHWASTNLWLSVAFIAIIGSALATFAYFGALRVISPTRATTWSFLSPVVAILISAGLGTAPSAVALLGIVITIAGVFIVNLPRRERRSVLESERPADVVLEPIA